VITNKSPDHGAWQTYEILKEISATKIPDFMSFEEGSTFPMAFATSAIAFYGKLDLPRPGDKVQAQQNGLLIWGASSSVGTAGIQLARASGYKVFATASPQHHDFLKSLGAFAVFDYKDPEVTLKIVAAAKSAGTPITVAYDTISENGSSELTADTLLASGGKGGRMVITLPYAGKEGIDVVMTIAGHVSTEHADVGEWLFNEYLTKALENKSIVPAPKIEIVEGGIPAAQKVFDQLKAGVSGKKLVVKVD
jgi:NADPH:quinone reductase-like Zn-dependent oxidoreductase